MPAILVRNLDDDLVERLKARAEASARSLQAEVRLILEEAVGRRTLDPKARAALARRLTATTRGTKQTDSAELIREDRER
ncbi:MAG: hypothetical protein GEU28_08280 [Dehalococcoidia bacterium]|nr:hypothetical protein [Dehalococcoidia bacterium]